VGRALGDGTPATASGGDEIMADDDVTTKVQFTYNERDYTLTNLHDQHFRLMSLLALTLGILESNLEQVLSSDRPEYSLQGGSAWQVAGNRVQVDSISYGGSLQVVANITGDVTHTLDVFQAWHSRRSEIAATSKTPDRVDILSEAALEVLRTYVDTQQQQALIEQIDHDKSFLGDAADALVELREVVLIHP
jgi:hypothetical protein